MLSSALSYLLFFWRYSLSLRLSSALCSGVFLLFRRILLFFSESLFFAFQPNWYSLRCSLFSVFHCFVYCVLFLSRSFLPLLFRNTVFGRWRFQIYKASISLSLMGLHPGQYLCMFWGTDAMYIYRLPHQQHRRGIISCILPPVVKTKVALPLHCIVPL